MPVNKELIRKTMNQILQNPEAWDQKTWHCGTSHCFAGWATILSGWVPNNRSEVIKRGTDELMNTSDAAQEELGIGWALAGWMFAGVRDMEGLYTCCQRLLNDEIDENGLNKYGKFAPVPILDELELL